MIDGPQLRAIDAARGRALLCQHEIEPDDCWPSPAYLFWLDLATGAVTPLTTLWPEWRETYEWSLTLTPAGEVLARSVEFFWLIADDGTRRDLREAPRAWAGKLEGRLLPSGGQLYHVVWADLPTPTDLPVVRLASEPGGLVALDVPHGRALTWSGWAVADWEAKTYRGELAWLALADGARTPITALRTQGWASEARFALAADGSVVADVHPTVEAPGLARGWAPEPEGSVQIDADGRIWWEPGPGLTACVVL